MGIGNSYSNAMSYPKAGGRGKATGGTMKKHATSANPSVQLHECRDQVENCTQNEELCTSPMYSEYMVKFCTKTCLKCPQAPGPGGVVKQLSNGHRPVPTTADTLNSPPDGATLATVGVLVNKHPTQAMRDGSGVVRRGRRCVDRHPKCRQWTGNGLCGSDRYTTGQKRRLCAKSCELC